MLGPVLPTVKTTVTVGPQAAALMRALQPQQIHSFLRTQEAKLVAAAKFNIASGNNMEPLTKKYGMRKDKGQTPGRGKFGSQDILRDTGQMYDSLRGVVTMNGANISLGLTAEGTRNAQLLHWHSTAAGKLPLRDPLIHILTHQDRFVREFERDLVRHLEGGAVFSMSEIQAARAPLGGGGSLAPAFNGGQVGT